MALCSPQQLRRAVLHAELGRTEPNGITVEGERGKSYSAPGITQYASNTVLGNSSRITLRGRLTNKDKVLVRTKAPDGKRLMVAQFALGGPSKAVAAGHRSGRLPLVLNPRRRGGAPISLGNRRPDFVRYLSISRP